MIRHFARKHPRTIAAGLLFALTLILALPYAIWGAVDVTEGTGVMTFDALTNGVAWQAIMAITLVLIVWGLKWSDITGFQGPYDRSGIRSFLWVGAFPALGALGFSIALMTSENVAGPIAIITIVLMLNFFVGLSEEVMFRGIVFGALREKHQLITAVAISSVAFGLLHLVNLGLGQAVSLTAFQVLNATALGALFCAIRLQTNSIWPPIFLHMIWNSYVMLGQALSETEATDTENLVSSDLDASSFLLPTILIVITYWVLRSFTRRTGQSLFHKAPTPTNLPTIGA
ncbi:CPBP family intramembrane metalloprotease [Rhodobacteraceae bacterium S2214]|nr:CPBP family intramembrane metalloprotease [Rhodobacteraceae bacterium S2214]